ncbi:MAG: hypothetical protein HY301_17185 [Verrucomicrobia bacterium]|nr:hypothetical protein [Verrucomicrobiota bacterium]
MKKHFWIAATFLLGGALITAWAANSSGAAPAKANNGPGLAFAQTVSTVTGVAISPLLGMSAVGAWQYFKADDKSKLPFYAQLWFWLPGLGLVGLVAAKDVFGAATPPGLKKPLDVAETFENKINGLVAAGALLPMVIGLFGGLKSADAGVDFAGAGLAAINGEGILGVLTLPFALACYGVVWLVSHVIHVLILLSPWGGIDAALKGARTAVLGSLTLISYLNPWVGMFLSLVIILIAWALAGWSFRMMVFGTVFSWDFLTFRKKRFRPGAKENWAFAARRIGKSPVRSYGRLIRDEAGKLTFTYRPWLVMAPRTLDVPAGNFAVGNALFFPSLERVDGEETTAWFNFPPRCNSHEAELGKIYGVPVRDVGIIKGFKAAWRWLRELFGFGAKVPAAAA